MNRKQFTLLIVLVLVVGGLGLVLSKRQSAKWQTEDRALTKNLLPDFPMNDVAQIRIQHQTNALNLVKPGDRWQVKERWNYPADFSKIHDFLRKMWEIKPVQSVKVGPSQLGRLDLLPPDEKGTNAATLVEFKDKNAKPITGLLLGKKYMRESGNESPFGGGDWPVGRYVQLASGAQKPAWILSDPLSDIEPKPEQWLSKDFFKIEKLRSVTVVSTNATNSWKVLREAESGEWKLDQPKEGENFEASKASSLNYLLSSPSFNDVASPEAKPETIGLDKPLVATLETFDNFSYALKLGKTNEDNYALTMAVNAKLVKDRTPGKDEKPEDKEKLDKEFKEKVDKLEEKLKKEKEFEKWTYFVSKWTVDSLLKDRKDFMADKKEEPKKDENAAGKTNEVTTGLEVPKPEPVTVAPLLPQPVESKPALSIPSAPRPAEPKPAPPSESKKETNAPAPPKTNAPATPAAPPLPPAPAPAPKP